MSDSIIDEKTPPAARRRLPPSLLWVGFTLLFCGIFAFASLRGVQAQTVLKSTEQYITTIRSVFDFVQRHYVEEVDPKVLYEGAMAGMLDALGDPYTAFYNEADMTDLNDTTQGSFGGVGLYISKTTPTDGSPSYVEVASPIEDTPGWRSGINPGDLIVEIDGESTAYLSQDEVLARLRGEPGEDVRLVIRRGEKLEFPVTITRAVIEVPTTKSAMIGDIGYLKLLTFTPMTADRAKEALASFKAAGYKGVVLDLRNNYGGVLNAAVDITGFFVDGGVVVSTKSRLTSENRVYRAEVQQVVAADIPVVVLINRGSASASEIVAGALKDRGRAYLVGERSFGKGSVQQVYTLDKEGFKITVSRYYTPSDVNIDKIGIPPDREVLFPEFTEAETEVLNTLMNASRIPDWVAANPNANDASVDAFARTLSREFPLSLSVLKRLIHNEQYRTAIAPVYDLDYDVQLQEAVKILREENWGSLMKTSKTLKVLQEEAARAEGLAAAS